MTIRNKIVLALLIVAAVLPSAGALAGGKPPADVTVFFASDTRGLLRRCGCAEAQMGGLSARASWIKSNYVPGKTVVVDAGDTFFGSLDRRPGYAEFYLLKAETIARAMKAARYDAALVGEYDLAYGYDFLAEAACRWGVTFMAANLTYQDVTPPGPLMAHTLVRLKGAAVGIIGVMDDRFPYADFPDAFGGLTIKDPLAGANAEIKRLAKGADVVIVLTHFSISDPVDFASRLGGADVVVQGHSREQLDEPVKAGDALLVNGFISGKHVGRLDLWLGGVGKAGKKGIIDYEYSVIPLDESVPPDPEVEGLISAYRDELAARTEGFGGEYLKRPDGLAGPDACKGCHAGAYADWSVTAHARAYDTLKLTSDQYDPECLGCHATGYRFNSRAAGGGVVHSHGGIRDVACEACHGPGEGHIKSKSGGEGADNIIRHVDEAACMVCHDEENSPYFNYHEYLEKGGAHRGAGH